MFYRQIDYLDLSTSRTALELELQANVSQEVEDQFGDPNFDPTWIMVITWIDQSPFPLVSFFPGIFQQTEVGKNSCFENL